MAVIKDLGAVTAYASAVEGGYTGTKEEFETLMASYATVAEEAAESAESASQSATQAGASAQTATTKASEASTSATQASASATSASQSASTATAKASEASASASTASTKADEASASASTASTKANEASQSATTASSKASEASASATSAQTAQTAAEGSATTAQTAAQTATQKAAEAAESARTLTIDTTLTQSGQAADAKKTGDEITSLKSGLNDLNDLNDLITRNFVPLELTINTDGTWRINGSFVGDSGRQYAYVEVSPGESYRLTTRLSSSLIPAIVYFNGNTFVSYEKTGAGTAEVVTDYEFTIPNGITKIAVQSAVSRGTAEMILKKYVIEVNVYTKSETDDKITALGIGRYGIRYSITDDNDLGERVFDAVGKTASIGIGSTDGASDFDNIYPWSDMKRCNIKKNASGAPIITLEGETGFAADGSNGDVFVRIPKFCYERYIENGFEYHVVSGSSNAPVHPAFIDGDKVLDAIYIGAYEASVSQQSLKSVSGVIPGNNINPSDFLTYAQANGDCYTLYGLKEVSVLWILMAVEFGKRNSNQIFGYGASDFEQPAQTMQRDMIINTATSTNTVRTSKWTNEHKGYMPIGSNVTVCGNRDQRKILTQAKLLSCVDGADYTDWTFDGNPIDVDTDCFIGSAPLSTGFCDSAPSGALTWHTGRANWITGSNTRNPMRYRWIENIVGNLWHFLPDVTFNDCQMYVCDRIQKYGFGKVSDGYSPKCAVFAEQTSNGSKGDVTGVNYWVSRLNNDLLSMSEIFGRDWNTELTSQKAFGAYFYMKTGLRIVCNGGGFDHLYRSNILTNRVWEPVNIKWYLYGARMVYKPVV